MNKLQNIKKFDKENTKLTYKHSTWPCVKRSTSWLTRASSWLLTISLSNFLSLYYYLILDLIQELKQQLGTVNEELNQIKQEREMQ